MLSPLLFDVFFAAATHTVLVRYSEHPDILSDFVRPETDGVEVNAEPLACVLRAIWGMLHPNNADVSAGRGKVLRR